MADSTSLRDRLASAVVAGEQLDLDEATDDADGMLLDEEVMRGWGPVRELNACDLAELVRSGGLPDDASAHPRGVQLRGARIRGRLELDFVTDALPLRLVDCLLDHGVDITAAHLPHLSLRRCRITHPTNIPFNAAGTRIGGDLLLDGSVLSAPLSAQVAVDLTHARIGTQLGLCGANILSESGPAFSAEGCEVGGSVILAGGFIAKGRGERGTLEVSRMRIIDQLDGEGALLSNDSGPALVADGCEIADVFLSSGFTARGDSQHGAVRLVGARITGQLNVESANVFNKSGIALVTDSCEIDGDLVMCSGFTAQGSGELGAVRLHGSRIAGQLNAHAAEIRNESGPAFSADACEIGGDLIMSGGFTASGGGQDSAVRVRDGRISGQFNADGAKLCSTSHGALDLAGTKIENATFLDGEFTAKGSGSTGAVVNLIGSNLGLLSIIDGATHDHDPQRRWNFDGCSYRRLHQFRDVSGWLSILADATPYYAAQPYQQLATVHRSAGHDHHVRAILIAQRRDQIRRGDLSRRDRAWARFTGLTLGYGWQPWRALYGLAAVFVISIGLAVVLGQFGALAHVPQPTGTQAATATAQAGEPCSIVERIGVGLDLGTPLIGTATKSRERCPIAGTGAPASALLVSTWVLQLLAWALGALFVVGFTGAVRKT